jgi:hypothetical protein
LVRRAAVGRSAILCSETAAIPTIWREQECKMLFKFKPQIVKLLKTGVPWKYERRRPAKHHVMYKEYFGWPPMALADSPVCHR